MHLARLTHTVPRLTVTNGVPLFICNFLDFGQQSPQDARHMSLHVGSEVALLAPCELCDEWSLHLRGC